MSESTQATPTPSEDQPNQDGMFIHPNRSRAAGHPADHNSENDLVVVDMGDSMIRLRDMGCTVIGPINGPNEGPPQYHVTKLWVDRLNQTNNDHPVPVKRPTPRSRPIHNQVQPLTSLTEVPAIDPTLLNMDATAVEKVSANVDTARGAEEPNVDMDLDMPVPAHNPPIVDTDPDIPVPTQNPPIVDTDPDLPVSTQNPDSYAGNSLQMNRVDTNQPGENDVDEFEESQGNSEFGMPSQTQQTVIEPHVLHPEPGPSTRRGKRHINLSPNSAHETWAKAKRRVIMDDEQAAMEAE